jgi:DNA-binding Lrp family transcriptional regulator
MGLSAQDRRLLAALADGLPLEPCPYARLAASLGIDEGEVIERLTALQADGVIRRLGLVLRHHELGYRANAMVVWDLPDADVDGVGARMAAFPGVTLCYRRPRRPPAWPYNLFCMIHGRESEAVLEKIAELRREVGLEDVPHEVLFSRRRFKQRGARYRPQAEVA